MTLFRTGAVAMIIALGLAAPALAQSTPHQDDLVGSYFAIWDQNGNVTAENVEKLYAPRLVYYGHRMTRAAILREKLNFVRRWPERHYTVAPGSAHKSCTADQSRCQISAALVWRNARPGKVRSGRSRVHLDLARVDGSLKIVREGATTLAH